MLRRPNPLFPCIATAIRLIECGRCLLVARILVVSGGLVGRDTEDRAVADFLARTEIGPAGLMVEGEPGIGKTTLLLDASDQAVARGFRVLSARGSPAEVSYAYAAVADLLSGVDNATFSRLPDLQRLALERARLGDVTVGPVTDERVVATAFLSVIEQLRVQAPVLLAIDDAQWLDASSKAVIGFAARRLSGRAGMLVTVRLGEPESLDIQSRLQFRRPETLARVRIRALPLGGLHALVAARLGHTLPRPTIARIHEISGGNPFFALELATWTEPGESGAMDELPDTLAALVRHRIGDADDELAAVLLATASAAAPTVELIGRATGLTMDRVVELLDSVASRAIVRLDGSQARFTHPLYATGVYADAAPALRRAMHRRLAEVVDQPEVKARHLALSATSGDQLTLSALDAAAEATFARGAPAAAAELVELALKLGGDTPQRLIRAGELQFRAGSLVAARRHLESSLESAPSGVLRSMALMWLGAVMAYDDDTVAAADMMAEAADEAGDNAALRLLCLLRLVLVLAMLDRFDDAVAHAQEAIELADQLGVPNLRSQARSISVFSKFARGLGVDHEALRTALELEDPHGGATTWFRASGAAAMMPAYSGDLEQARIQMRALQQRMLEGGTEVDILWAAVRIATITLWAGRYEEAAAAAREAVERAEQMDGRLALVTAWTVQAAVAAYTGHEVEARTAAQSAIDASHQIGAPQLLKEPRMTLGFLEVSLENYPAALAVLQPLLDGFRTAPSCDVQGGAYLPDAIEAMTALGHLDDAEYLVETLEAHGATHGWPWTLAVAARGRAHVLAGRGELPAAHEALDLAMTHHARLPMPFERARTQLLLGALQRRRRRYPGATASLRAALETFEQLGTPLWAARARAELGRLDHSPGSGPVLTAAERRVAALAAEGMSNKQIAAELFISVKTVEMNLSRVYRKLGIRSRSGLSAALASGHA
ncbi:AAA family ATPase [Mycolicibacter longobardus]|uniref:helix-turn-helix transcriptional regulator n=1 Tax=Mycolicibacter longobardus TaxID=1108812 RepID=UPI0021F355BF|nr:LuxR family transcriptional regulator [Mycolicibacter longobardus]MCV7382854.1 AAA family ATPase [Mycolicibacter longobardus]